MDSSSTLYAGPSVSSAVFNAGLDLRPKQIQPVDGVSPTWQQNRGFKEKITMEILLQPTIDILAYFLAPFAVMLGVGWLVSLFVFGRDH